MKYTNKVSPSQDYINKNFTQFKYNKFNPSVNEWTNSIYTYESGWDKKNYNLINNKVSHDLINSYFNMKFHIKKKVIFSPLQGPHGRKKLVNWLNHLSLSRVFVGILEFKHNLQSLNILIYIFNKEETLLLKKINKLKKASIESSCVQHAQEKTKLNVSSERAQILSYFFYKKNISHAIIPKSLKNYNLRPIYTNIINNLKIRHHKIFLYKLYLVKLYFNKYKFNYNNLFYLKKILFNIYKGSISKIKLNIINLKYLHLDNSIYVEAITRKLKDRNKKALRVLRNALILPKIPTVNNLLLINKNILNKLFEGGLRHTLHLIYYKTYNEATLHFKGLGYTKSINDNRKSVFYNMKNTHIVGIRLEGSGRLTRRLTASRAVQKITYLGNLKNIFSSYQGLSSVINKGFEKSNISYINQNSTNRNGAFGIKSWQNTI